MTKTKIKVQKQEETKRAKFERIAQRRTNIALKFLRLLGNLADRRNYDYSEAHAQQIFTAIDQEVRAMKTKFRSGAAEGMKTFRFERD